MARSARILYSMAQNGPQKRKQEEVVDVTEQPDGKRGKQSVFLDLTQPTMAGNPRETLVCTCDNCTEKGPFTSISLDGLDYRGADGTTVFLSRDGSVVHSTLKFVKDGVVLYTADEAPRLRKWGQPLQISLNGNDEEDWRFWFSCAFGKMHCRVVRLMTHVDTTCGIRRLVRLARTLVNKGMLHCLSSGSVCWLSMAEREAESLFCLGNPWAFLCFLLDGRFRGDAIRFARLVQSYLTSQGDVYFPTTKFYDKRTSALYGDFFYWGRNRMDGSFVRLTAVEQHCNKLFSLARFDVRALLSLLEACRINRIRLY